MTAAAPGPELRLQVDWPACRARGLCAELLPERIALDEWGYPLVDGPVPADLADLAGEVVAACPHRALRLVERPPAG
ncbi:MAG: ferredoxin [Terracoccus sp.]